MMHKLGHNLFQASSLTSRCNELHVADSSIFVEIENIYFCANWTVHRSPQPASNAASPNVPECYEAIVS